LQHFYEFIFAFIVFAMWQRKVFVLFLCKENAFPDFQLVMTGSPIFCNGKQTKAEKTDT
jgi:hypothetical protein